MDISNKAALVIAVLINLGGFALEALGIEVAAWPLLIFSLLGIVLILVKNFLDSKQKNKETPIKIEVSTSGRMSKVREANIIITNLKKYPITIVRILTKEKDKSLDELSTQGFDLPQTLEYQAYISLPAPYIAHNIEKIERICAEDGEGKRWDADKKAFEQAKKILRNFIGHSLIYPNMGHELDEDKIT